MCCVVTCRGVLQLALDAPKRSLISKAADKFVAQHPDMSPLARLLTKEDDWGPCLATLMGHTDSVYSVAIHPDGKTIVSGSGDKTMRWVWSACMAARCPGQAWISTRVLSHSPQRVGT